MRIWSIVLALPLVLAWAAVEPEDDFRRERKKNAEAKDALEGQAPPALAVEHWMNLPDGADSLPWSRLKGKVVVIDFWGTW